MGVRRGSLTFLGMTARNLYRHPLRTVLTVLGVSVGVIAIVALGTLVRGLWTTMDAVIHSGDIDLVVYQRGVSADILSNLNEAETRTALAEIPDVQQATCGIVHVVRVGQNPFVLVLGVRREEFWTRDFQIIEGRAFEADDEVIIGAVARRELGLNIGDILPLGGRDFKVVGVYASDVIFFSGGVTMGLAPVQKLSGRPEGEVMYFRVKVRDGADPAAVADKIEHAIPTVSAVGDVGEYKKVDLGLEIASDVVAIVSFVATVIGAIIVTNTMWMSVHERTREIGLLRAVGWSARKVTAMIMVESAGVALLACVFGSALGVALAKTAAALPLAKQFADPVMDPSVFGTAAAIAITLGVVGGIMPAWRAARISPVEALRYE